MRWRLPPSYSTEVVVPARIDDVWTVVSDPERVGEWSCEARGAEWLEGATEAALGARFRGQSQIGWRRWGKACEIVELTPPRRFAFRTRAFGDENVWSFDLSPVDGGTRIRQEFRITRIARPLEIFYFHITPTHQDRSQELRDDLRRLGEVAAAAARGS